MGYSRDKSNFHIETGTWIATLSGGATTTPIGGTLGNYTKIGKMVIAELSVNWSASVVVDGTALKVSGLPYSANDTYEGFVGDTARVQYGEYNFVRISVGLTEVTFKTMASNSGGEVDLLSQASGTYSPHTGFTLTYYTDD